MLTKFWQVLWRGARRIPPSQIIESGHPIPPSFVSSFRTAGIVPYTFHDGLSYFLLSKNLQNPKKTWSEFGGPAHQCDPESHPDSNYETPVDAALRHFNNKTLLYFRDQQAQHRTRLENPLTRGPVVWNDSGRYLLHFLHVDYFPLEKFNSLVPMEQPEGEFGRPLREFKWIPVNLLVQAIQNKSFSIETERGERVRLSSFSVSTLRIPGMVNLLVSLPKIHASTLTAPSQS
eukprot:TRINITY_DN7880_c0_g1_i1.p1 TRINITY_DN7880_c0_g1~~TRINITY_DN7880_c0_g1_i1.p1  ORF type:complete len:232 (-),score=35.10 TRINITY_DN7880_c0_g1_i1:73-768(-)